MKPIPRTVTISFAHIRQEKSACVISKRLTTTLDERCQFPRVTKSIELAISRIYKLVYIYLELFREITSPFGRWTVCVSSLNSNNNKFECLVRVSVYTSLTQKIRLESKRWNFLSESPAKTITFVSSWIYLAGYMLSWGEWDTLFR